MALEKQIEIASIEILASGAIQIRTALKILEGTEQIAVKHTRRILSPGDDISKESAKLQAIAKIVWAK